MRRLLTLTLMCVLATVWVSQPAVAAEKLARVAPKTINFGTVPVTVPGTDVFKGTTITNVSGSNVLLLVDSALPDDFGFGLEPGSTCPVLTPGGILAAGASCDAVVRFTPTEFFAGLRQTGTLTATLRDPTTGNMLSTISITVVGRGSTSAA